MVEKKVKATKKEYEDFDKWMVEQMGPLSDEDKAELEKIKKERSHEKK